MIVEPDINLPWVVAEVSAAFWRYEQALLRHDLPVLADCFLQRPDTVRYGVAEQQYGAAAIAHWRVSAAPVHPQRQIRNEVITTYGPDYASVCVEFGAPDMQQLGRQTQTWVRSAQGWKIAAAHVSVSAAP
ncbi:MAG: oxalurate catabolism protein HpxZ [Steroidobacteraceae bacterium]